MAFPPDLPSMQHAVINSLASVQLSHRCGISNTVIPNVYHFAIEPQNLDSYPCELRGKIGFKDNEILVLQPTRIVPRKWIERSIEIVRNLNLPDPKLVISHASGDEGDDYHQRVQEYAVNMGVKIVPIDHLIRNNHAEQAGKYHISDIYKCSDLVTYPSGYEGFGNAFLEAIYYKKPIVVNRYSIYIADIEPKGFDVIALDGFVTHRAIERIERVLQDESYRSEMVEKNYVLAQKYFSYEVLEKKLLFIISTFDQTG
jgi:glycosyltransferase involved in cell wall biosynthesis